MRLSHITLIALPGAAAAELAAINDLRLALLLPAGSIGFSRRDHWLRKPGQAESSRVD